MHSSTFLLKAASLAFLATSTFAAPFDPIGIAPPKHAITAVGTWQAVEENFLRYWSSWSTCKRAPANCPFSRPIDFGTEIITATYNRNPITYTRHIGVDLLNSGDNDEVIRVSGPLLATIQAFGADNNLCHANDSDLFPFLDKRDDGDTIPEVTIPPPCLKPTTRWGLINFRFENILGGMFDLFPMSKFSRKGFVSAFAFKMMPFEMGFHFGSSWLLERSPR
jgi:hypothetical protein